MYGEETQKAAFWRCPSSRSVVASAIRFISDLAEDNFKICPLSLRQRCSPYSNTVHCFFLAWKTRGIKCKSISQEKFFNRYIFHINYFTFITLSRKWKYYIEKLGKLFCFISRVALARTILNFLAHYVCHKNSSNICEILYSFIRFKK